MALSQGIRPANHQEDRKYAKMRCRMDLLPNLSAPTQVSSVSILKFGKSAQQKGAGGGVCGCRRVAFPWQISRRSAKTTSEARASRPPWKMRAGRPRSGDAEPYLLSSRQTCRDPPHGFVDLSLGGRRAETESQGGFHQIAGQVHRPKRRRKLGRTARTGRAGRTGHAGQVQRHPKHLAVMAGKGHVAGLGKAWIGTRRHFCLPRGKGRGRRGTGRQECLPHRTCHE